MTVKRKHIRILKALYIAILSGFFVLLAQDYFSFANERKLKGSFTPAEKAQFNWEKWFSGAYQEQEEKYANENFGFRQFFVRVHNQIAYSLFNSTQVKGVVIGKQNYLYEDNYIEAYFGESFIGKDSIREKVQKMEKVQQLLSQKGIELVVVFAPSKVAYLPEYIPSDNPPAEITNYSVYKELLENSNINFIDFNQWFVGLKDKTKYPLYPKTGIHWSRFGELKAADSLLQYLENLKNKKLPDLKYTDTIYSTKTKYTDADIEESMNLLIDIPDLKMAYPNYKAINSDSSKGMKTLVIGDSYYWGLYGNGFASQFFDNGQFWYYHNQIYEDGKEAVWVKDQDIMKEIEKHEVVILLSTVANLYRFAFGFIDDLYNLPNKEKRIQDLMNYIRTDSTWFSNIKKSAEKNNISIEEALRKNAEYAIFMENKK